MMSSTAFSAPMGFLEAGDDVEGIIAGVVRDIKYFALVRVGAGHFTPDRRVDMYFDSSS